MSVRRQVFGIFLIGLAVAFVVGCGVAPAPTATPLPPTIAPTATPPPTAIPPTQAPSSATGSILLKALTKAKEANSYRVELSMTGLGDLGNIGIPTPEAGTENEPITLVALTGEVNGKDAHFTLEGMLTALLGMDPSKTFEVITVDGQAYLKGPVPLLGAHEEKWYVAPASAASFAEPPLTPAKFLDSFGEAGISPADFKQAGSETLDGQACQVYAGDKSAVMNAFNKLSGAGGATQEDLDSIDRAEFKFWVCADGFVHQIKMFVEGHEKDKPDQKGSFEILMKLTDFNADIKITPPADAIPLQIPGQGEPGVTPTP